MTESSMKVIPTNPQAEQKNEEEKSQARLDYEEGMRYLDNQDLAMAANAFHNALMGWEEEGDQHGVANASDKLGDLCVERGDYDKAIAFYDRAYEICSTDFDRYSLFTLEKKKAALYLKMERHEDALDLYWDIFDEYSGNRDPKGVVETLETMATIFLSLGDKDKAADCYQMIAKTHRNFKHAEEAAEYENKAAEIRQEPRA